MKNVKYLLKILVLSIIAGMLIGIGGVVFLSCESKYLGAVFFSIGLFFICECGFKLYTGAIGYALDNKLIDNIALASICIGNFLGTLFISTIVKFTRIYDAISTKASVLVETKLNDSVLSVLILSILCGMLIYLGVDTFKKTKNDVSKVFSLLLVVFVFIISSYEHCIANMFYFELASVWTIKSFLYILLMILGNSIGGLLIPALQKIVYLLNRD